MDYQLVWTPFPPNQSAIVRVYCTMELIKELSSTHLNGFTSILGGGPTHLIEPTRIRQTATVRWKLPFPAVCFSLPLLEELLASKTSRRAQDAYGKTLEKFISVQTQAYRNCKGKELK